jgi:hypothetical protein
MSTVRVDFLNGRVDRTMPVILEGHMSDSEWTAFSEKLDRALGPTLRVVRTVPLLFGGLFIVTVIIFATTFATTSLEDSSGPPIAVFVIVIIVPILWVVVGIGSIVMMIRMQAEAINKLRCICAEESRIHPCLSFHIKEEGYFPHDHVHSGGYHYHSRIYLEVQVTPRTIAAPDEEQAIPVVMAQAVGDAPEIKVVEALAPPSVAMRLDQLDQIKHRLSTEEYERKRLEILDSL